jgi:hypothetical protein
MENAMFFNNGLYLVKKNPGSMDPWLGVDVHDKEIFASLLDYIGMGHSIRARPKVFMSALDAFIYIKKEYPKDVGVMQVYHAIESAEGIKFTHVPWPPY